MTSCPSGPVSPLRPLPRLVPFAIRTKRGSDANGEEDKGQAGPGAAGKGHDREGDTVAHLIWDSLEFRLLTYCEQNVTKKTGTEGEWILKTEGNITRTVLIDCSFFLSSETECAIKFEIPDLMIPYAEYTFTKVEPEA